MNLLSLCSGIAGLDLGVKIALPEARTVCYVERDPYCQRVLLARMSDGSLDAAPLWGDLRTFDGRPWRGSVDCVVAGFPCQDISNAGRREGIQEGNRSGLWFEVLRIVREVEPRFVFLENVSALLVRGLDTVLGGLAESGFDAEWGLFSAADVGAPHLRKRVFILGHAAGSRWGWEESPGETVGRSRPSRRLQSGRSGSSTLADTQEQRGELRPAPRERPGRLAGEGAGVVAHGGGERLEGDREAGSAPGPVGRGGGAAVDDARHEPRAAKPRQQQEGACLDPGAGALPLFPPGPADRDGWAAVLGRAPHLEPAVRRMDARFSRRLDRLRCLGNAVVPLTAALAFTVLAERIEGQ